MTRCKHCSYNYQLKSSGRTCVTDTLENVENRSLRSMNKYIYVGSSYNQTGQCYEVQLAAYNAMTNHLRRVLLAKSVVDSGKSDNRLSNNSRASRRVKNPNCSKRVRESPSQSLINRLAYDTKHHPHEIANMNWGFRNHCSSNYRGCRKGIRSNSTDSSEDFSLRDHQESLKSYRDKFRAESVGRKANDQSSPLSGVKKSHRTEFENSGDSDDPRDRKKLGKSDRERGRHLAKTFPCARSSSEISCPGTPEFIDSTSNVNSDRFNRDVSMYVKFVYDITREVMDRGLYSDQEIERVFEKHFQRNVGRLSKDKMLQEINSLKKSLNMNYDSEYEEEKEEDLTNCGFALGSKRSFGKLRNRKEATRITDNRVDKSERINPSREIIVTEEDILTTLLEMNLNPDKAQEICKSLENRSKEVTLSKEKRLLTPDEEGETVRSGGIKNIKLRVSKARSNPPEEYKTSSSAAQSLPLNEDDGIESEDDINVSLYTKESTKILPISNEALRRRDSPAGSKSDINKSAAISSNLSNNEVVKSDDTVAGGDSSKELNGAELLPGTSSPQSSTKKIVILDPLRETES